ncbi:MAG TPA: antitoxin VbhA family protein [Gammaproteobacteria bacterium]|jgi:hypothetical protein|nr:antitoxin VbhA family protein [Chromatiales bacterium]HPE81932.1 antitoxin VbhA family protein [Gammaproteobacteria bacterium]
MKQNRISDPLAQVEASLRLEGLTLDDATRELLRRVVDGEITADDARAQILAKQPSYAGRRPASNQ